MCIALLVSLHHVATMTSATRKEDAIFYFSLCSKTLSPNYLSFLHGAKYLMLKAK